MAHTTAGQPLNRWAAQVGERFTDGSDTFTVETIIPAGSNGRARYQGPDVALRLIGPGGEPCDYRVHLSGGYGNDCDYTFLGA